MIGSELFLLPLISIVAFESMPAADEKAVHLCPSLGRKNALLPRYFPKPETSRQDVPEKPFGLSASPLADHQYQYWPRTPGRLSVSIKFPTRHCGLAPPEIQGGPN